MDDNKFKKPPSFNLYESEKKARRFIEGAGKIAEEDDNSTDKVAVKVITIRVPEPYYKDIKRIMKKTGMSMNAVCLQLLRPAIKQMIKELEEE